MSKEEDRKKRGVSWSSMRFMLLLVLLFASSFLILGPRDSVQNQQLDNPESVAEVPINTNDILRLTGAELVKLTGSDTAGLIFSANIDAEIFVVTGSEQLTLDEIAALLGEPIALTADQEFVVDLGDGQENGFAYIVYRDENGDLQILFEDAYEKDELPSSDKAPTISVPADDPEETDQETQDQIDATDAAPVISSTNIDSVTGSTVSIEFTPNESATAYYLAIAGDADQSAQQVINAGQSVGVAANVAHSHTFNGLDSETLYSVFIVVVDSAEQPSLVTKLQATTLDITVPVIDPFTVLSTDEYAMQIELTSNESGTLYAHASQTPGLSADAVIAAASVTIPVEAGTLAPAQISDLDQNTAYTVYAAVEDAAGNVGIATTSASTLADTTVPVVSGHAVSGIAGSTADMVFTSNENGTAYVLASTTSGLSDTAVKSGASNVISVDEGQEHQHSFSGLSNTTLYYFYVLVEDNAANQSGNSVVSGTTLDDTAPILASLSSSNVTENTAELQFSTDESGTAYYLASTSSIVDKTAIKTNAQANEALLAPGPVTRAFTGLIPNTNYYLYVVVEDASGNISSIGSQSVSTSTTADTTPPVITSSSAARTTGTTASQTINSDEAGTAYFYYSVSSSETATVVKGNSVASTGIAAGTDHTNSYTGLSASIDYYVHAMVEDAAGNQSIVASVLVPVGSGFMITSTAPTVATTDTSWEYASTNNGAATDDIEFSISNAPTGMSVNSRTGKLYWTPGGAQATADATDIVLTATNTTTSEVDTETFTVNVTVNASSYPNAYFVSNDSTGGTGTVDDPFDQIRDACNAGAGPGDTIYIRGGLFQTDGFGDGSLDNSGFSQVSCSGDATGDILFTNFGNEKPHFQSDGSRVMRFIGDYITVENLEISGGANHTTYAMTMSDWWNEEISPLMTNHGIVFKGHHGTFRNNIIHSLNGNGINTTGSGDFIYIQDNIIYNSAYWGTSGSHGMGLTDTDGTDGSTVATDLNFQVTGNLVFSSESRITSHVWSKGAVDVTTDEGTAFIMQVNNGSYAGGYLAEDNFFLYNGKGTGAKADNIIFRNNTYYDNGTTVPGTSSAIRWADGDNFTATDNAIHVADEDTRLVFSISNGVLSNTYTASGNYGVGQSNSNNVAGDFTSVSQVFNDPVNLDFSLAAGIPAGTGADAAVWTARKAEVDEHGVTIEPTGYEVNYIQHTCDILEYALTSIPGSTIDYTNWPTEAVVNFPSGVTRGGHDHMELHLNYTCPYQPGLSADSVAPVLSSPTAVRVDDTSATLEVISDEAATVYYLASQTSGLTESDVRADLSAITVSVSAGAANTNTFTGLAAGADYYLYAVAVDANGNVSNLIEQEALADIWATVLATGDSSSVTTAQVIAEISNRAAIKITECKATLDVIYDGSIPIFDLPTAEAVEITSINSTNIPILFGDKADGSAVNIAHAGEKDNGARYVVMGANPFDDQGEGWQITSKDWTLDYMNWLLGFAPGTDVANETLNIMTESHWIRDEVNSWISDNGLTTNWTVFDDNGTVATADYDLYIAGHSEDDDEDPGIALSRGKPVIQYMQHWHNFYNRDNLLASNYGVGFSDEFTEANVSNGGGHASIDAVCESELPVNKYEELVQNLDTDDFDFDYAGCTVDGGGKTNCDGDAITDSNGQSLNQRFYEGAETLRDTLAAYDIAGTNIFTDTMDDVVKLMVVLGDKYRQNVSFPMYKSVTDGSDFFRSLYADYSVAYVRGDNAVQSDLGNFDTDPAGTLAEPKITCNFTATPTTFTERTAVGCYAAPGTAMTFTRTDADTNPIRIHFNYQKVGSTRIWAEASANNSYSRPYFLTTQGTQLLGGESVTLSTPYGGPIYVEWDGVESGAVPFNLNITNTNDYLYIDTYDAPTIAQFVADMATDEHDWVNMKTDYAELLIERTLFEEALDQIDGTEGNGYVSADVTQMIEDTNTYLVLNMLSTNGYAGDGLNALPADVANFCTTQGVDCTDADIHAKPKVQHMVFDYTAGAGAGSSGNPFDGTWPPHPLHWGSLHEHGHNLQRSRTKVYSNLSSEVSVNIWPYLTRVQYAADHGQPTFDIPLVVQNSIDDEGAYSILQAEIAAGTSPSSAHPFWNSSLWQRLAFYYNIMFSHGSYDIHTFQYVWERNFTEAIKNDANWAAQKDALGFSNYSRTDASNISAEDFRYIVISLYDGRDWGSWFEIWGVDVSAAAQAQVTANGAAGTVPHILYDTGGLYHADINDVLIPANEKPLDGVSSW